MLTLTEEKIEHSNTKLNEWLTSDPGEFPDLRIKQIFYWRGTLNAYQDILKMQEQKDIRIKKLEEACKILLTCSLPNDVSGRAMIERARGILNVDLD